MRFSGVAMKSLNPRKCGRRENAKKNMKERRKRRHER
jgi:hypothetical protein